MSSCNHGAAEESAAAASCSSNIAAAVVARLLLKLPKLRFVLPPQMMHQLPGSAKKETRQGDPKNKCQIPLCLRNRIKFFKARASERSELETKAKSRPA